MSGRKGLRWNNPKLLVAGATRVFGVGVTTFRTDTAVAESQHPKLVEASVTVTKPVPPAPKLAAPGTALYEARRGDTVISVARHYLGQTSYLTSSELAEAMHGVNDNLHGTFLKQ